MSGTNEDGFDSDIDEEPEVEVTPKRPERKVVSTDDLQTALSRETAGRQRAEERAAAAEREAARARGSVSTEIEGRYVAEMRASEAAIGGIEADIARLEQEALTADETGDRTAAFAALRKIARLEAQQLAAEGKRDWLKDNKETILAAGRAQEPASDDDVDLKKYSPAAREWIKANPRYLSDAAFREQTLRAHHAALADGIPIDSDDYFSFVDSRLAGSHQQQRETEMPAESESSFSSAAATRPRASAQMPVQRRAVGGQPPRGGPIRLTAEQREGADISLAHIRDPKERYQTYYENLEKMQ